MEARTPDGCDALRDDMAALAIGALTGHDRARVLAHLEACPACTAKVDAYTAAADSLTGLIPDACPPQGFSERAMAAIRVEQRGPRSSPVRRFAAAATVIALLVVGGGAGAFVASTVGRSMPTAVRSASLRSVEGAEGTVVLVSSGQKGWLVMTVHDAPEWGTVMCVLTLVDGTHRPIGTFSLAEGYGSWTAPLPVPASSVKTVDVRTGTGSTVVSAHIG